MDDFSIFGNDFDSSLAHLMKILEVCVKKRLVLSWEKSYFMVREGVVLRHIISGKGLDVDKAKIEVIQNLPLMDIIWPISQSHFHLLFIFVEMKFIHCHSCVMFAMKSMSRCND